MATFTITFETISAAFDGDGLAVEVARILHALEAVVLECGLAYGARTFAGRIQDSNGNKVGTWKFGGEA